MLEEKLDKEDILILLLAASSTTPKGRIEGITRLEKLMFLLQHETHFSGKIKDKYQFEPWKFGPFSKEIYDSLDFLLSCDLVTIEEIDLANYIEYMERRSLTEVEDKDLEIKQKIISLTERGHRVAEKLKHLISDTDFKELVSLKDRFLRMPLNRLIQYVYHKYPDYTGESIHPAKH